LRDAARVFPSDPRKARKAESANGYKLLKRLSSSQLEASQRVCKHHGNRVRISHRNLNYDSPGHHVYIFPVLCALAEAIDCEPPRGSVFPLGISFADAVGT